MQRPSTTRSVIACALALSATTPAFSQTTKADAFALEQRSSDPSTRAAHVASVDPSNSEWNQEARTEVRLGVALNEEAPRNERAAVPSGDVVLERRLERLRARLAGFLDARFAAVLADATRLNVAPQTVDRGQLMRASLAGNLRASYWLLQHPELLLGPEAASAYRTTTFAPGEQERALRLALYRRLVVQAELAEDLEAFGVLGHVRDDLATGWLDAYSALRALVELEFSFPSSRLAHDARLARAFLLAEHGRGIAHFEGLAARLFASLLGDPSADIASAAADALWRLQHLRVGCQAPPLCGNDVVGNELCLLDFRGRVVLVRFWSMEDLASEDVLQQDAFLVQHFWDHPVSVLGINRDGDRELYLQLQEQLGLPGNQVYEGPISESLMPEILERRAGRPLVFDAWREARSGSSYLLDSRGVIRAVDPPLAELQVLTKGLVDEIYLERRLLGF